MGWSTRFRERLAAGQAMHHRVRPVAVQSLTQGEPWQISSTDGGALGVSFAETGHSGAGARLRLNDWGATLGGFSVALVGDPAALLRRTWRGQLVVHEVSFDGDEWEPVESGVVRNLSGGPGRFRLECQDLTAALRTRYTTFDAELALFSRTGLTDAESEDGLNTQRGVSDEAYTPAQATYATTSGTASDVFQGDAEAGAGRLVVVDPQSSRRFYIRYTGTSGASLTGCTDDVYGTTARSKASGQVLQVVPFIEDHPIDVIRKVLTSTGASWGTPFSSNGTYDTLPAEWGYALPRELLDHEDMDFWKPILAPATGSAVWTMLTEYEQPDGLKYLTDWLKRGGLFLAMRQGRLTVRGATDPDGVGEAQGSGAISFGTLRGEDLVPGSIRWSAWDAGQEYREVRVYSATGNAATSDPLRSRPAKDTYRVEMFDTLWTNESAHRALIQARLAPWCLTLPESFECATHNPLARGLAVGDVVPLDIPHFGGRVEGAGGFVGRAAMAVGVDVDWWGGGPTRLAFSVPPPSWWVN